MYWMLQVFVGSVATLKMYWVYWQLGEGWGEECSWVSRLSLDWVQWAVKSLVGFRHVSQFVFRFACLRVNARTRRDVGDKDTWWVLLLWCQPGANPALVTEMVVGINLQSWSPSSLELNILINTSSEQGSSSTETVDTRWLLSLCIGVACSLSSSYAVFDIAHRLARTSGNHLLRIYAFNW